MKLSEFLVNAKSATYPNKDETNNKILKDGAKELIFESNNFKYRDRYYGFNPFIGEEIVWENNKILWAMNYFGKISSNIVPEKKVYKILQNAMLQIKKDRPFRGPNNFKNDDFEYVDESNGNIHKFIGIEKILYKEQEIYRLNYHGGLI